MKISVLMSIYKNEKLDYFDNCMKSIWYEQILKPDEIVLVQDGPLNEELYKSIYEWKNKLGDTLKILPLEKNVGLGNALNIGLKECSNELIARMDTDDISLPERFKIQLEYFEKNNVDVLGTYCIEIDENNNQGKLRKMPANHKNIYDNLFTNPFIHPTIMIKKSLLEKIGGYDKTLSRRQDYDLWFKCAKFGANLKNIEKPLIFYRFTNDTHKKQNFKLMLSQAKIGYKGVRLLNQPYWKAIACYVPVIRSLLPNKLQHIIYKVLKKFDPRQK